MLTVSAVIPALNEAATIASAVASLRSIPCVNDVVVAVDCATKDDTAEIARSAGARVVISTGHGLGNTFRAGINAADNDLIFRTDGDIDQVPAKWVEDCLKRYVAGARLVKTFWDHSGKPRLSTLLVVLPAIRRFFPDLTFLKQPLSGLFLFNRTDICLENLRSDMGVDLDLVFQIHRKGLLIDQVEIDPIFDRQKTVYQVATTAEQVLNTLLDYVETRDRFGDLLLVMAHADDAEIWSGGTVLVHAMHGCAIDLVLLTETDVRRREAEAASVRIPNHTLWPMGYHSLSDIDIDVTSSKVSELIISRRPTTIITHHPQDIHPEHQLCASILHHAILKTPWDCCNFLLLYCDTYNSVLGNGQSFSPDYFVDISCVAEEKRELIRIFESQNHEYYNQMTDHQEKLNGFRAGVSRAEAYETARLHKLNHIPQRVLRPNLGR